MFCWLVLNFLRLPEDFFFICILHFAGAFITWVVDQCLLAYSLEIVSWNTGFSSPLHFLTWYRWGSRGCTFFEHFVYIVERNTRSIDSNLNATLSSWSTNKQRKSEIKLHSGRKQGVYQCSGRVIMWLYNICQCNLMSAIQQNITFKSIETARKLLFWSTDPIIRPYFHLLVSFSIDFYPVRDKWYHPLDLSPPAVEEYFSSLVPIATHDFCLISVVLLASWW